MKVVVRKSCQALVRGSVTFDPSIFFVCKLSRNRNFRIIHKGLEKFSSSYYNFKITPNLLSQETVKFLWQNLFITSKMTHLFVLMTQFYRGNRGWYGTYICEPKHINSMRMRQEPITHTWVLLSLCFFFVWRVSDKDQVWCIACDLYFPFSAEVLFLFWSMKIWMYMKYGKKRWRQVFSLKVNVAWITKKLFSTSSS